MSESKPGKRVLFFMVLLQIALPLICVQVVGVLTSPDLTPVGEQRIAVILAHASNAPVNNSASEIYELVFGNASRMYQEISYGKTWLSGDVCGWITLDNTIEFYGNAEIYLVKEAVAKSDVSFDFSGYDRLLVIHSGVSWQASHNTSYPSTQWLPMLIPTMDGRTFLDASVVSEHDGVDSIIHELGHSLGAVDLYNVHNTKELEGASNDTYIGRWCAMGSGYAQMCLFTKLSLGFIESHEVFRYNEGNTALELIGISEQKRGFKGIRIDLKNDSRYYLIEARTASGFDQFINEGVLVTVVDESKGSGNGIVDIVGTHLSGRNDLLFRGDMFQDPFNGFVLNIDSRTENGFVVKIGTNTTYNSTVYTLRPPRQSEFVSTISISENVEGVAYCAIGRTLYSETYLSYVEVLRTIDSGIHWNFMYSTLPLALNYTEPKIANTNEGYVMIALGRNGTERHLRLFNFSGDFSTEVVCNLTDFRGLDIAVDRETEHVSVVWGDWNSTTGLQYIETAIWTGREWIPGVITENAKYPKISNIPVESPEGVQGPLVIYRDALIPQKIVLKEFHTTDILGVWENTSNDIYLSGYDVLLSNDRSCIVYCERDHSSGQFVNSVKYYERFNQTSFTEIRTFVNSSLPKLFSFKNDNKTIVGTMMYNEWSDNWQIYGQSDQLLFVTDIPIDNTLYIGKTTTGSIDSICIIAELPNRGLDSWRVTLVPEGELTFFIFYTIESNPFSISYPTLVLILFGAMVIVFVIVSKKETPTIHIQLLKGLADDVRDVQINKTKFVVQSLMVYLAWFVYVIALPIYHISLSTLILSEFIGKGSFICLIYWGVILTLVSYQTFRITKQD